MPKAKDTRPALQISELNQLDFLHQRGWAEKSLVDNIEQLVLQDLISVRLNEVDMPNDNWDGTLLIQWKRVPKAISVVNHIIGWARADEVSMPDPKTLRLWWD